MTKFKKVAFLFPGQGAQYPGMAKDFYDNFPTAKQVFEEADDRLGRKLLDIAFNGPENVLTETKNSQLAIYVASVAIWKVLKELHPHLQPAVCAGLSLGEYTALTASGRLDFHEGVSLVNYRAQYMNDACESTQGTMAVVLGLDIEQVEQVVAEVNMPQDLWAANFNCPGQIVISGTLRGIEAATAIAKAKGAKRVLPLQVHGAFHSGLMQSAEEKLTPHIKDAVLTDSSCALVMNVTGGPVKELSEIRQNLIKQVTHSVKWEQGIRYMLDDGVDLFVELGCGKTLAGFNKRIGSNIPFISIEKITDLDLLRIQLEGKSCQY